MIRSATAMIMTVVQIQVGARFRPAQAVAKFQTAPSACGIGSAPRVPPCTDL